MCPFSSLSSIPSYQAVHSAFLFCSEPLGLAVHGLASSFGLHPTPPLPAAPKALFQMPAMPTSGSWHLHSPFWSVLGFFQCSKQPELGGTVADRVRHSCLSDLQPEACIPARRSTPFRTLTVGSVFPAFTRCWGCEGPVVALDTP